MNNTIGPTLLGTTAGGAFLIAIVGTSGNLLAVVALLQNTRLRQNPSTAFMINLPACLLPVCALGMPLFGVGCLNLKYYNHVLVQETFIVACFTIGLILSQVHLHTICALALNRLLAVVWPAAYKGLMQKRKVRLYLALLWVYSALLWLPLAFGAFGGLKYKETELMVSMADSQSRLWKGLHVFITYILPILFASTCYITMYLKVRYSRRSRKVRACRKSVMTPDDAAERQWDDHVTRTILVIFIFLVLCSVPHMVVHVRHLYDRNPTAWLILHLIFWVQFCLDPIVYVTVSSQYRAACGDTIHWLLRRLGLSQWFEPSQPTPSSSHDHPTPWKEEKPNALDPHDNTQPEPTSRNKQPTLNLEL